MGGKKEKEKKETYTKYEVARILGARALQLAMNAPILLKIPKEKLREIHYDTFEIAKMEFEAGVLPITVRRPLPRKMPETVEAVEAVEVAEEERPEEAEEEEPKEEAIVAAEVSEETAESEEE